MLQILQKSTQVTVTILMVDSSDHLTGKTGLSAGLTIYATKAGVSPAAITPTVAELDATNVKGLYSLVLTTTHTNTVGELQLHITASGADPTDVWYQVSTRLFDDLCFPTTSGRSLDVTATGEAGIDWANIGAPTTTNNLSGTSTKAIEPTTACIEPTAVVAASPTIIAALSWLLTLSRNKITQTATTQLIKADDGSTTIATSTVSDDGTTFTKGEFA